MSSARIEQLIQVIEEVKERFEACIDNAPTVHSWRIEATHSIARRRGIRWQTVNDKVIRGLSPEINGLLDFDRLLTNWLSEGATDLASIFLSRASDDEDRELIRNAFYKAPASDILLAQEFGFDPNEKIFVEGRIRLRLHLSKERNRNLIASAKQTWQRISLGRLRCEVCDFSFSETYGKVGDGFIEAHHKAPISSLATRTIVTVTDLAPVCSNCHRMLHRRRPWLTVEQLREVLRSQVRGRIESA